jgi:hypothetical protein
MRLALEHFMSITEHGSNWHSTFAIPGKKLTGSKGDRKRILVTSAPHLQKGTLLHEIFIEQTLKNFGWYK